MVKVKIAWGKQSFDLDVDVSLPVPVMKAQIQSLTNIPVDRQKIMLGGILKDDADLSTKKIKEGQKIMVMGTAEGKELKGPGEKTIFEEDLTAHEKAKMLKEKMPDALRPGMTNLGNTCYMNSVVQCLNVIPELKAAVKQPTMVDGAEPNDKGLVSALDTCFKELDLPPNGECVTPFTLVLAMRNKYPMFAEKNGKGEPKQQDAEECLNVLLSGLKSVKSGDSNIVDKLFSYDMQVTYKCQDAVNEEPNIYCEPHKEIACHLGTQTEPVGNLVDGIKLSLVEEVEKMSPTLERNAIYQKVCAMASLPGYLVVHFKRFSWKGKSDWAGTEATKTKVCRRVNFTRQMDVYEFGTEELKKELLTGRRVNAHLLDLESEKLLNAKPEDKDKEDQMDVDEEKKEYTTGVFDLVGIVTHRGRDADGGHYIGWVRSKEANGKDQKEDEWLQFDDDTVTNHLWKDLDLAGGRADTDLAYLCVYKKKSVKATEALANEANAKVEAQLIEDQKKADEAKKKIEDNTKDVEMK